MSLSLWSLFSVLHKKQEIFSKVLSQNYFFFFSLCGIDKYSPLSITIFADRLQVIHDFPLIETDAVRLYVLMVVLGPLQTVAWDQCRLHCPLTASMQRLQQ